MTDGKQTQLEKIEELSQKVFRKPSKDIKYLLVTNYVHQSLLDEEVARTGLYQWLNVFKGEVKYPRDVIDYNDYDIVQVNLSAQDVHLINTIKSQIRPDSNTKLVVNNDYVAESWGQAFEYIPTLEREISGADMYFGTEYFQTTALTEITGKKCFIIPHPADVRRLKMLPKKPVKNIISTIARRYDMNTYVPSLVIRNHGLATQLIGYDPKHDRKQFLTTTLYDYVLMGTNFFEFCDQLRTSQVVYDPFTLHSYSRATVDTAAMGVPVVGSNRTQSMNICYPHTCVDPWDVSAARHLINKILTDKEFRQKVIDTALEKSEYYNHTNSKERYLIALSESSSNIVSDDKKLKSSELITPIGDDVLLKGRKKLKVESQ